MDSDQTYQVELVKKEAAAMLVGSMSREETTTVMRAIKDEKNGLRIIYVTPEKVIKVSSIKGCCQP